MQFLLWITTCIKLYLEYTIFGFGLRFTALIDIIIMILVSIIMISKFSKIDKRSGYINLIYLMWLVYAGF